MSEQDGKELIRLIQSSITRWMVGFALAAAVSLVSFYYSTTYRIQNLESKTQKIEIESAKRETVDIKLNHISNSIEEVKQSINVIHRRIDDR